MRTFRTALLLIPLLVLSACGGGPSQRQVLAKHAAAIDKARAALKQVHADLPAPGSTNADVKTGELKPPLRSVSTSLGSAPEGNTEWLHAEQLLNPDDKGPFDTGVDGDLGSTLAWTDSRCKYYRADDSLSAGPAFEEMVTASISKPYLIVIRASQVLEPRVDIKAKTFTPGSVRIEGFIYSMPACKRLGAFAVTAHTPDRVDYQFKPGEEQARADAFAHSALWEAARAAIVKSASAVTGGEVRFR